MTNRSFGVAQRWALAWFLLAATASNADVIMPGLTSQWIARDMEMNGLPVSLRALEGDRPIDEVLTYYRNYWGDQLHERRVGNWHVLAGRKRQTFSTLRVREHGMGIRGVLSSSPDPRNVQRPKSRAAEFRDYQLLSQQQFQDAGKDGENITLMTTRSVSFERQSLTSRFLGEGWTLTEDRAARSADNGHVLQFVRARDLRRVVIYRNASLALGRTLILITTFAE